jgi:hypothetical protein
MGGNTSMADARSLRERMGRIAAQRQRRPWMEGRRGHATAMDGRGRRHGRGRRGGGTVCRRGYHGCMIWEVKSCLRDLGSNFPGVGATAAMDTFPGA